ncbi:MAG TPA: hypothetical protein PLU10_08615 [Chitinophagaceae bacterium]|nr:hypothetical protein [Chitinophagaceae bacterium]
MRYTFRALLFIGCCFASLLMPISSKAIAKKEEPKQKKAPIKKRVTHQIGINIASFVDRFLKFNNTTNTVTDPHLLSYRLQLRNRVNFRVGIGYSSNKESLTESTSSSPRTTDMHSLGARVGVEYYLLQSRKWKVGAGIDALYSNTYSHSITNETGSGVEFVQTAAQKRMSLGPTLSIQYFVHPRVSIGTEGGMYAFQADDEQKQSITGSFPSESKSTSTITGVNSSAPIALFIHFNF